MPIDHPSGTAADRATVPAKAGLPPLHGSFTLSRVLAAPPGHVFTAFSDIAVRRRWFRVPGEPGTGWHELDFRVGGHELAGGTFAAAGVPERIEYRAQFLDIVPDDRIVFAYTGILDGQPRWASLTTIELAADTGGTRLTRTEQYVFLALTGDGRDDVAHLEGTTRLQFNALESVVVGRRREPR
ncbi:SRPBCC domain-containing protein [Frankia sp. AiPs1]|uniref:SRPBCC domain-containing protein n=1 Tax=Frankia sp. AiPs1 TaxID=573493 RepID=UPI0020434ACB|nr:SRPBCC domain-containing protein [Frankia sp. AiPs1]MCM3924025.1 SRPBCC domain-containing protein [Frankia sp. AiPs1]